MALIAHPAFGLVDEDELSAEDLLARELGRDWLELGRSEQAARRQVYFTAALSAVAGIGAASFRAEAEGEAARAVLAALPDAREADGCIVGPLTEAAAGVLVSAGRRVDIEVRERAVVWTDDGWRTACVRPEPPNVVEAIGEIAVEWRPRPIEPQRRVAAMVLMAMDHASLVAGIAVSVAVSRLLDRLLPWGVTLVPALIVGYIAAVAAGRIAAAAVRRHEAPPGGRGGVRRRRRANQADPWLARVGAISLGVLASIGLEGSVPDYARFVIGVAVGVTGMIVIFLGQLWAAEWRGQPTNGE